MKRVWAGTTKGLISLIPNQRGVMSIEEVFFEGFNINTFFKDSFTERIWVSVSHKHWGEKLYYLDGDVGKWGHAKNPTFEGLVLPSGKPAKLKKIWTIESGQKPGELWLGTEPGALFHSKDNAENFHLIEGLWKHPSRMDQKQWFGAGRNYSFLHSVVKDPVDSKVMYVAVSCAGIFKSTDGGESWSPANDGLKATYLPRQDVEVGHDPHILLINKSNPNVLWQQNHCGIFVSKNKGESWNDVSGESGFPKYGFAMAIDEEDPAKAWVIPAKSDEQRVAPELKLEVFHTNDYGENWVSVSDGLPKKQVFDIVLRQSFAKSGENMVFGTTNGNLYCSRDSGNSWDLITSHFTCVNIIAIET